MEFGKLSIVKEVKSDVQGHRKFLCLCKCGNDHIAIWNNLVRGITTQCKRCSILQRTEKITQIPRKENLDEYSSYRSMLKRCSDSIRYLHVQICDRWIDPDHGFSNFLEDMGKRPSGTTLDRIDGSLGYCKENCRWASASVQNHNKRKPRGCQSPFKGVTKRGNTFIVQFWFRGQKISANFTSEMDAATYYDNLSESHYGDRPNSTASRVVVPAGRRVGSCTLTKSGAWRVRLSHPITKQRISFGSYESRLLAEFVLANEITKLYY